MNQTVYDKIIEDTGFSMDQIRMCERQMIAWCKMVGVEILSEEKFHSKMLQIKNKISLGLSLGTIIDIIWSKGLDSGGNQGRSVGPGFSRTHFDYHGRHVIYRNKSDKTF